jgi:hypothetical protein
VTVLYLGTFAFGVIFTIATFALGAFGGGHDIHLHGVDFHGAGHGDAGAGGHDAHVSPFNLSTIAAFLAWFGGAGYLLSRFSDLTALTVLFLSGAVGVFGGGLIFVTLARYVLPRLTELREVDFQIEGVAGRVTVPIRAGEVGEVVYSIGGAHQVGGARSVSGEAIERGTEVVILRRDKGIIYVERWDRFASGNQLPPGEPGQA